MKFMKTKKPTMKHIIKAIKNDNNVILYTGLNAVTPETYAVYNQNKEQLVRFEHEDDLITVYVDGNTPVATTHPNYKGKMADNMCANDVKFIFNIMKAEYKKRCASAMAHDAKSLAR